MGHTEPIVFLEATEKAGPLQKRLQAAMAPAMRKAMAEDLAQLAKAKQPPTMVERAFKNLTLKLDDLEISGAIADDTRTPLGSGGLGVLALLDDAHIGALAMARAIGLALDHRIAAEPERIRSRLALGPGALAGREVLEAEHLGGFGLPGDRRVALRQPQAVDLADDGVLGDAKPIADLAGGEAFVP